MLHTLRRFSTVALSAVTVLVLVPINASAVPTAQSAPKGPSSTETVGSGVPAGDLSVLLSLAVSAQQSARIAELAAHPLSAGHRGSPEAAARRADMAALVPAAPTRNAVQAFVDQHGLTTTHATSASLLVSGSPTELAPLFRTTLAVTPQGLRYATTPLIVPAELTGLVTSAIGLDERPLFTRRASAPVLNLSAAAPRSTQAAFSGDTLRAAYNVTAPSSTGAGITVGTLQLSGWTAADLSTYAARFNIPLSPGQITNISVGGASTTTSAPQGGALEVTLDQTAILAVAPAAKQRIYIGDQGQSSTLLDVLNTMADDAVAGKIQVASSSWGACEAALWGAERSFGAPIDRMVGAGATFFAASGDFGSDDCLTSTPAVDFPASWPTTVGVGGTRLSRSSDGSGRYDEVAWDWQANEPGSAGPGGSGGGISTLSRPSYQQHLTPAGTRRLVPDVSAVADPATPLGFYQGGSWKTAGGTSLSAPLWAGFLASALSAGGRTTGLGNILPTLYQNPAALRDITVGNNGGYQVGPGYDLVTGLGSPNWDQLAHVLVGTPLASGPAPTSGPAAVTPVSIAGTGTQTPPYASIFTITGTAAPGSTVSLHFHKPSMAAAEFSIVRTVSADSQGRWSRDITANTDYTYYATATGQTSATVVNTPTPLVNGPSARVVRRGSSYALSGQGAPGSTVWIHFHKPGMAAADYGVVRAITADGNGNWVRPYAADIDYRLYVSRQQEEMFGGESRYLLQAR